MDDQHTIPISVMSIIECDKIGCNILLNSIWVQFVGISNVVGEGGPNVKLEKWILISIVGKSKSTGILSLTVA